MTKPVDSCALTFWFGEEAVRIMAEYETELQKRIEAEDSLPVVDEEDYGGE